MLTTNARKHLRNLCSRSPTTTHCCARRNRPRVLLPLPVFGGNPRSGNLSSRFLRKPAITTHTLSGWLADTCQSETGTRCLLTPTLSLQVHYTLFAFRQSDRILPQGAHNYSTFTRTKNNRPTADWLLNLALFGFFLTIAVLHAYPCYPCSRLPAPAVEGG